MTRRPPLRRRIPSSWRSASPARPSDRRPRLGRRLSDERRPQARLVRLADRASDLVEAHWHLISPAPLPRRRYCAADRQAASGKRGRYAACCVCGGEDSLQPAFSRAEVADEIHDRASQKENASDFEANGGIPSSLTASSDCRIARKAGWRCRSARYIGTRLPFISQPSGA